MATNYPGSVDTFANPSSSTTMDATGYEHDVEHTHVNDAVLAVETELGVNPSGTFSTVAGRADAGLADGITVNVVATSGSAQTLAATYAAHKVTMSQNCAFTLGSPSGQAAHACTLLLLGAYTPSWTTGVKWNGGVAPTHTTPSIWTFATFDSGTTWYGAQVGKAFA
jgi:hypothetical protein